MTSRYGSVNINRLSRESGVGLGTVARLKSSDTSVALDKLDKLAAVFGVEPWKLLQPDFSVASQALDSLSPMAVAIGRALDAITEPEAHSRAYALSVQVLQLANAPAQHAPAPAVVPTLELTPAR